MSVVQQLTEMYEENYDDYVRMYLARAGANDVEDLIQESFYRALYYADNYRPDLADLDYWFSGIIENSLKDLYKEKRNGNSMHSKLTPESAIVEPRYDNNDLTRCVLKELEKKQGDHRQILYLYFICGYDLDAIHKVIGGSYHTIEVSTRRFKSLLRETYPELGED